MSKYIENNKSNIVNLRFFAVFGKYEDYTIRFISRSICNNLLGKPITINQNLYFDYIYINDVVRIIDHFIKNDSSQEVFYNIGTGNPIDLLTIAKKINEISSKKSEILIKKTGLNNEYSCNNGRLMKELGNFEFTPIDKAVEELYSYYELNLNNLIF